MQSLAVLALALVTASAAADETVLFQETFDHYGDRPLGLHESCAIWEWPPAIKMVAFQPRQSARMFDETAGARPGESGWENYELRFKFKFIGESPRRFDLELLTEASGGGDEKVFTIGFADRCRLSAPGARTELAGDGRLPEPLVPDEWYEGIVRGQAGRIAAYLDEGELVRIGTIDAPRRATRGFNIRSDSPVVFEEFKVVSLSGRAAEPQVDDACLRRAAAPPPDDRGAKTVAVQEEQTLAIPTGANTASAAVRVGEDGKMNIHLVWADDSRTTLAVGIDGQSWRRPILQDGRRATEEAKLPDGILRFREIAQGPSSGLWQLAYHVRPDINCYENLELRRIARHWERFPAASQQFFKFEVRLDEIGAEFWIDDRYAGRKEHEQRLKELVFDLSPGGAIRDGFVGKVERHRRYLPLNVAAIANPGALEGAALPIAAGDHRVRGIPMRVVDGRQSADVGVVREHRGSWALECDLYVSRTALSGIADTLRLSVPVAQYHRAYVLCAVEEDAVELPVLTARLTRFVPGAWVGRGPAIASTTVTLPRPGESLPQGVHLLGEVRYTVDGGARVAPLYLVEIPLDVGAIQDVLFLEGSSYLDFDLIGKPRENTQQWKLGSKPDPQTTSAVHLFGLTLERSPVEMSVLPLQVGNAYYPDQRAGMTVRLRPLEPGECQLHWTIRDLDGRELQSRTQTVAFVAVGGEQTVQVPFPQQQIGWYEAVVTLADGQGRPLLSHRASFVRTPRVTRRAGYDSPYYTWWFGGAHGTTRDIGVMGPLLELAGIHRTGGLKDEEMGAPWKLTTAYLHAPHHLYKPDQPEQSRENIAKHIAESRAKFPHVKEGMIFHESLNGPFPLELLDLDPQLDEAAKAYGKRKTEEAIVLARAFREQVPGVKLVVGNTQNSLGGLAHLFRNRIPAECIDYMGEESVGQAIMPEKNEAIGGTAYTFWLLRQLAIQFGYERLMPAAAYERNYRSNHTLGPRRAAAWTVRDALIVHAWGSPLVPIMGPEDTSYSYYNSVWGDFGMFTRHPETYPHPGFAAMATLTHVLDRARFQRQLDTGSATAYALEFAGERGNVYPAWVARGEMEMYFTFDRDAEVLVTDLWGRTQSRRTADKQLAVQVSGEPVYLQTSAKAASIAPGRRRFPQDALPEGVEPTVAAAMASAEDWSLDGAPDPRIDRPAQPGEYPPFRRLGNYKVREVKDEERGPCLELELLQEDAIPTILDEYVFLRLNEPAPVPGEPTTVGVWVKGNSGWGQLMWEFKDAEGEVWLSCGTGGFGCNVHDWNGQASINFDGWNLVQFPIRADSPVRVESPGGIRSEWLCHGRGNRKIDYPIKLTGVAVSTQRKAINLTRMDAVPTVIRLQELLAY